ncbi:hypothetical protein IQ238_08905 [Pleurocapsales cyanobacterium LEGE 06147]|nr:hypothetical protein [Pleurocapsales cyanobacterium LEGE 06147]
MVSNNSSLLGATGKKQLLQEFKIVADRETPPASSLRGLKYSFSQWLCLNGTSLMQRLGYNQKKILAMTNKLANKPIILNIGCLEQVNNNYVNADMVPFGGIRSFFNFILGKTKLNYDLLINIAFYDQYLLEFADGIILSHVLEHIHPLLAITALKNCFAYLKQERAIRISVPYLGRFEQPDFPINFPDCQIHNCMLAKNNVIYGYGHQFMYDAELLNLLMEEAGFSEVKEVAFGEGLLGETDPPERKPRSIYLTGIKKT